MERRRTTTPPDHHLKTKKKMNPEEKVQDLQSSQLLARVIERADYLPTKKDLAQIVEGYSLRFTEPDPENPPQALKEYLTLKRIEQLTGELLKVASEWATQEAKNYNEKERKNIYNSKVVINAAKPKYDYSGNQSWKDKKDEIAALKKEAEDAAADFNKQVQMAENELKTLEVNMRLAGTAEVTDEGKETISVTILD